MRVKNLLISRAHKKKKIDTGETNNVILFYLKR